MNANEALTFLERTLDSHSLSATQYIILRGVWEGDSYVKIATDSGYDHGYIKDAGAQLWRLLSKVFNKKVTKSNVRNVISRLAHQEGVEAKLLSRVSTSEQPISDQPPTSDEPTTQSSPPAQALHPRPHHLSSAVQQSWDEFIDIGSLYGRTEELRCLESWVTGHCLSGQFGKSLRLLTLLGMGGVGKTALSVQLVKQVAPQFDYVAWRSLSGHQNYVQTLCHHPAEPILASGAHHIIHFWNLETGQTLRHLDEHKAPIWKVVFSHDGQYLASSCFDQTTRVWDWRTGHCVWTLQGHSSWVFGVDFSPDGRWLATSSMDQTIKLWDALTGECVRTIQVADDQMPDVTFSPDGHYLVGGGVQGRLMMWAMDRDAPPRIVQGHGGFVSEVRFSPDGKTLVSSSHDRTIKLWDAMTLECLKTLEGHENMVSGVAFSADGAMVASASHDETVRVWDVATGECREVLRAPRPYEGMNIEGATGLDNAQKATLQILGAVEF
ncbi:MAG: hypothetical protein F6K30_28900 [Cyanothece sp. SIO2G6]|nr:hypothetical protein [Cyanothece sp. SIO2G6]